MMRIVLAIPRTVRYSLHSGLTSPRPKLMLPQHSQLTSIDHLKSNAATRQAGNHHRSSYTYIPNLNPTDPCNFPIDMILPCYSLDSAV